MNRILSLFIPITALAACSGEPRDSETVESLTPNGEPASVALIGNDGSPIGSVAISQDANGTTLSLSVEGGLDEGLHGVHLHETGACELPDFSSAGGHWNPEGKQHGRDNPEGAHVGDLANMAADADGKGSSTFLVENVLVDGGTFAMADADGTALVIHAGPDDYMTDPSGDSGARVGCAVLAPAP